MRFIERTILKLLVAEAQRDGFRLSRVACQPATGEPGDEISAERGSLPVDSAIEHMDAWDSFFCLDFQTPTKRKGFWVLWIPSNGEDVISDYLATPAAEAIMKRVYAEIES